MNPSKTIFISTITANLLVLAGCTTVSTATNTDVVTNTDTTNTNVVVNTNENTNSDQVSEVDTSDWLTYTSDEYGFSLQYPSNYSFDESHEGVNFKDVESDSVLANQENIKFYVQNYDEAPDKKGEAYALLSTKTELSDLKSEMIQSSNVTLNGIPVDIYYSYDVPGSGFYRGANFFADQDYIMASMVFAPEDIEYPNHSFNSDTREWSTNIIQQLNDGKLISQHDEERISIFNTMIGTLQLL